MATSIQAHALAFKKITLNKRARNVSPLNHQGHFTADQVRAYIFRTTGHPISGAEVSIALQHHFKPSHVQGYFVVE